MVIGFALWTIAVHSTILFGGHLIHAMLAFAGLVVAFLLFRWFVPYRSEVDSGPDNAATAPPDEDSGAPSALRFYGVGILCIFALATTAGWTGASLWWTLVQVLGLALLLFAGNLRKPPIAPVADSSSRREWALALIAVACALAALVIHRGARDDVLYLSLAARAADSPTTPLMSQDPIHGIEGMPLLNPAHRVQTLELLGAAISFLSGIPAVFVMHWMVNSFAAALTALALARLLRILAPSYWLWAVVGTLVILVVSGETPRVYGNYFLIKLWHGKSVLTMIALPLLAAYAIEFMRKPSIWGFLKLFAAHTASIGLTASALFTAPVVATIAALTVFWFSWRAVASVGAVMLSSGYLLLVGAILSHQMHYLRPQVLDPDRIGLRHHYSAHSDPGDWFGDSIALVFGNELYRYLSIIVIGASWVAFRNQPFVRRFVILFPLVLLLTLLNPYIETWVASNITAFAQWRLLWILPFPLIFALVLFRPAQNGRLGLLLSCALLLGYAVTVPTTSTLSRSNHVRFEWPPVPKYQVHGYEAACAVNQAVPTGATVLVPSAVSVVIPNLQHAAAPLVPRTWYMKHANNYPPEIHTRWLPKTERDRRLLLKTYVDHHLYAEEHLSPDHRERAKQNFRDALLDYDITAVCIARSSTYAAELQEVLLEENFREVWALDTPHNWTQGHLAVWARPEPERPTE